MRKLILEEWISLDGYAADRKGNLDFFPTREQNKRSDLEQMTFLESVDTVIIGRKTYELFLEFWPAATTDEEVLADWLNTAPKIIVSNTLKAAPWGKWPAASVMSGDAINGIARLKDQPGKDIILWGSISLAQAAMNANLVDEYRIHHLPTVVGGGRLLFPEGDEYRKLKLIEGKAYEESGAMFARYRS